MYCPTHSGQVEVPAKDLLRHARQNFTHVSRSVFSRVVTFSFPESSKSNDGQYGANYRGLLAKPSVSLVLIYHLIYCNLDARVCIVHAYVCA